MPDRSSLFLLEPEQLRTLLTLADQKTFSTAAIALGVQQSAVSHQMRRMEEKLGRRLFNRTGTGVEPTSDGEALIIYARAMLDLDAAMRRHIEQPRAAVTLRIGMVEDLNRTALPRVLWMFSRNCPKVEFRIVSDLPLNLIQQVSEGRLDAAAVRHQGELVGTEPLWADQLVWVGRSDTVLPVCDPVPLVLPPAPSTMRDLVLGCLQRAGRSWRVPFEGGSLASLEAGLRSGLGIGGFPAGMERFEIAELGQDAGLPALGQMHYALIQAPSPASDVVAAFCQVFKNAARLSFRGGQSMLA